VINSQIRASYWMTFPLAIVNFNHFFIQPAPGVLNRTIHRPVPPNDDTELIGDRPLNIDHNVFGRGLVMVSLNINSLFAHIDELRVYMNTSKIDVLTINETKLDSTIQNIAKFISRVLK
jgi:hypothetical protein